jgi:hypothetical protein
LGESEQLEMFASRSHAVAAAMDRINPGNNTQTDD